MRIHIAIAACILVVAIGAGVWFARPTNSAPKGAVALRNQIAQSDAVVVTYFTNGAPDATTPRSGLPDNPTMTFIRGKGWVWQVPAGPGDTPAGMVISSGSHALLAVAPGCYLAIPSAIAPPPWQVPGVNIARDLDSAPDLKSDGDQYSYSLLDEGITLVTEDLEGIAENHSYSARMIIGASPSDIMGRSGLFDVREATASERHDATALLDGAHASATTPIELDYRVLGDAPTDGPPQALQLVSPQDCPADIATDYTKWDPAPPTGVDLFRESRPNSFVTAPLKIGTDTVTVRHVVPVTGFIAPSAAALTASTNSEEEVRLRTGAMFAVLLHEPAPEVRDVALIYRVALCKPAPWFPCR